MGIPASAGGDFRFHGQWKERISDFASSISDKNSVPLLRAGLEELESLYGNISHFDQVSLHTIYHGKGRNKKLFREMSLPKGMDRDSRRGESGFGW